MDFYSSDCQCHHDSNNTIHPRTPCNEVEGAPNTLLFGNKSAKPLDIFITPAKLFRLDLINYADAFFLSAVRTSTVDYLL
jgi:hypothetical protein